MMHLERMLGQVPIKIVKSDEELTFTMSSGDTFRFYHDNECCEVVSIEEVIGDFEDLLFLPILRAEEKVNDDEYNNQTWTFYTFATRKGYVDVRWLGSSNGYYSQSVNLEVITDIGNLSKGDLFNTPKLSPTYVLLRQSEDESFFTHRQVKGDTLKADKNHRVYLYEA